MDGKRAAPSGADDADIDAWAREAVSLSVCGGAVVRAGSSGHLLTHAPLTLYPSPVPGALHSDALALAAPLNRVLCAVAADAAWLRAALAGTAAADPFTARLLALLPPADAPAPAPAAQIAVVRTDYFAHQRPAPHPAPPALRMVEANTVAASFAALGGAVAAAHAALAARPGARAAGFPARAALPGAEGGGGAAAGVARALAAAHAAFGRAHGDAGASAAVLFVVQPAERNVFDQDALRHFLWGAHGVLGVRASLGDVARAGALDGAGVLRVDGRAVSVVYFRAGYTPADYPSEQEWMARELIERSVAAKCPSAGMQLAGAKKVQQLLDAPGGVERFAASPADAAALRRTFARQWSLAPGEGAEDAVAMALADPAEFVLKPQREGGGNNLYVDEMAAALRRLSPQERAAYVLMERIHPLVSSNVIIREGRAARADVVSEFGVFGILVSEGGETIINEAAGTLLRSKAATQDDGGVAAGVAVLDSPYLT